MFELNDKVYCLSNGYGKVTAIFENGLYDYPDYPIKVEFPNKPSEYYTKEGYYEIDAATPFLYHGEPKIIAPPTPVRTKLPDLSPDEPIFVWDSNKPNEPNEPGEPNGYKKRHFKAWVGGLPCCWNDGKTSFTAATKEFSIWRRWRLPKVETTNDN